MEVENQDPGEVFVTVQSVDTSSRPPRVILETEGTRIVVLTDDEDLLKTLAARFRETVAVRFCADDEVTNGR